jgi:tetratricopeptide (TPR) repeat protein
LLNNNRIEEAEEYLKKCLEIEPGFDKALITLGNVFVKENKYDDAINQYNKILEKDLDNEICLFNKAFTLYKKEDFKEASKIYEELINKNKENNDYKMGLGICYYQLKEYDKAIEQFDLILETEAENYDALYNKAICLYYKEDKDECNNILKKISKKIIKKSIIDLSQGIIALKNKKYDSGIKKFENVLSKEYTNIYALHGRGQCLYEKGIIEEAINSYDEALKNKPDFTNALNSKANALDKLEKKKEALEVYQKLNEIEPENAVYKLNYALCLYELENLGESENILLEAEKLSTSVIQSKCLPSDISPATGSSMIRLGRPNLLYTNPSIPKFKILQEKRK